MYWHRLVGVDYGRCSSMWHSLVVSQTHPFVNFQRRTFYVTVSVGPGCDCVHVDDPVRPETWDGLHRDLIPLFGVLRRRILVEHHPHWGVLPHQPHRQPRESRDDDGRWKLMHLRQRRSNVQQSSWAQQLPGRQLTLHQHEVV